MHGRFLRAIAALTCAIVVLSSAGAQAAPQWYDGPWAFSRMQNCVTGVRGTGAGVRVGFQADAKQAPHAGQTFYAHVYFGMVAGCVDPQHATLEVIPPPGASLAVDKTHPIRCGISTDGGNTFSAFSPCPSSARHGAYGELLAPPGEPAFAMPRGRIFVVEFPIVARKPMRGLAGGSCPKDLDEVLALPHNDCLMVVAHIADGYADPWLVVHQNLVVVR